MSQLTWKVAKEPPIRDTSPGPAVDGYGGKGFSVFWLGTLQSGRKVEF